MMKKYRNMLNKLIIIVLLLSGRLASAQQSDCQVLLPRIAGTYEGECKKGLANGKGLAQGIDVYDGEFRKGLPDGRGTYRWADGTYFEGYWKQGLREGSGRMVYSADSVITGYWKADKYAGKEDLKNYEVLQSRYVARSTFSKVSESPTQVKIRFTMGGTPNTGISDFSMIYSSGDEFKLNTAYVIQNATFPLTVRLAYVTWNQMHTVQTQVSFEFRINVPGNWDVNIQN
jgi:hypothetical protein